MGSDDTLQNTQEAADVDDLSTSGATDLGAGGAGLSRSKLVYTELRKDIGLFQLTPGTVLNEAEIGARYSASRTPVRQALQRLEQEGYVEKVGRQLRIREFSFEEVEELYQLREAFEKMAVRLCIERATDRELDEIRDQIASYRSVGESSNLGEFSVYVNQFHWSIARLSGNKQLFASLMSVVDKVTIITNGYLPKAQSITEAELEHSSILQAIYDRDVTVAEAAVRAHLQRVVRTYRARFRSHMGKPDDNGLGRKKIGPVQVTGSVATWIDVEDYSSAG